MKYYALEPVGDIGNLSVREKAGPLPEQDTDVVVELRAASLNYKDIVLALGWLPLNNDGREYVPLSDGAGEIVGIGAGVRDFRVGDRVVASVFPHWKDGTPSGAEESLGRELPGMLSEYACLPAEALLRIPESMSFSDAAAFPCAGVTAWNALIEKGALTDTQTVLTMGTGGVSMFALQIAKAKGAKVISLTGSKEKEPLLSEIGADHVINYKDTENWDQTVRDLTDGVGVDIVVEVGGAQTFQRSLNATAFGGRISAVGVLAGVEGMADPTNIIFNSLTVNGVFVGNTRMLHNALQFFHQNNIRPVLDRSSFDFASAKEAYSRFSTQSHFGKVVIDFAK